MKHGYAGDNLCLWLSLNRYLGDGRLQLVQVLPKLNFLTEQFTSF